MRSYLPEGESFKTTENRYFTSDISGMAEAKRNCIILEGKAVMCTPEHDMIVELPCGKGIIPREEGALGIREGATRDIALLSKVGKPVCFKVLDQETDSSGSRFLLSRRAAQEECLENYISQLASGDIIPARVTHLEKFGCFVDIGCGIPSLIPIDAISVSRITHPNDRFYNGQLIKAVVKGHDGQRILLSHKELLGTWEENADRFAVGQTVTGIIRSVEEYGIFVELAPNLAGLAEVRDDVSVGQSASVYIKAIIKDKMKVKLLIVDVFDNGKFPAPIDYFTDGTHIDSWIYSTPDSHKHIESRF
ncbi:MAG: 30S ribosomal protein S1 [Ruminococcus sp.]|nr:30S ribosomal protein S1 [Ruminococcus sp.]